MTQSNQDKTTVQEGHAAGPLRTVLWIFAALGSLLLVVALRTVFLYTHTAPLTPERLQELPYFRGSEVLEIAGTPMEETRPIGGKTDPNWVLYRTAEGETHAVRLEWDLYLPRFRVEKGTDTLIPAEEVSYTFTARDYLGTNTLTVRQQTWITKFDRTGAYRQQSTIQTMTMLWALGLLVAVAAVCRLVRKARHWGRAVITGVSPYWGSSALCSLLRW